MEILYGAKGLSIAAILRKLGEYRGKFKYNKMETFCFRKLKLVIVILPIKIGKGFFSIKEMGNSKLKIQFIIGMDGKESQVVIYF